jgi:hypothetical protein
MESDVAARWFQLFKAFGRDPSPDSYAAIFHPEGEVADAGMATPTPATQVREAIAHVLRLMPDLRIEMKRYRTRGHVVFVEAANTGTINGTKVAWDAIYRVHLRDGLVYRGRRFYDQTTLFRALRPELGWLPELSRSSANEAVRYSDIISGTPFDFPFAAKARIGTPDQKQPLSPADLKHHLPGAQAVDWAGDATLAFVEWRRGALLGADRLDLQGGRVVLMRRDFDTLGLLAERDPSVTALRAALLSNAGR